jgi:hypothetical protein
VKFEILNIQILEPRGDLDHWSMGGSHDHWSGLKGQTPKVEDGPLIVRTCVFRSPALEYWGTEGGEVWDFKTPKFGELQRSQPLIQGDRCQQIFHTRRFPCKGKQSLKLENFVGQNCYSTTVIDLGGVSLNHWFWGIYLSHPLEGSVNIMRSTVISHCGDRSCVDFKNSRVGRNPYRGFTRWTRGGLRRIVSPKLVWIQTSCGCTCNRVVIAQGHIEGGAKIKCANAQYYNIFTERKREGHGCWEACLGSREDLFLT